MGQTNNIPRIGIRNAIFTIFPYKIQGQWVFDDDSVGLVKEAFIAGADELLDVLTEKAEKCVVLFSQNEFPGHDVKIDLIKSNETGSDYKCDALKQNLWLCPALFLYYPQAPRTIYIKIKK